MAGRGVVIKGGGEVDVDTVSADGESAGGEVRGARWRAEEVAVAVVGPDVSEGVSGRRETCGTWDIAGERAVGVVSQRTRSGGDGG